MARREPAPRIRILDADEDTPLAPRPSPPPSPRAPSSSESSGRERADSSDEPTPRSRPASASEESSGAEESAPPDPLLLPRAQIEAAERQAKDAVVSANLSRVSSPAAGRQLRPPPAAEVGGSSPENQRRVAAAGAPPVYAAVPPPLGAEPLLDSAGVAVGRGGARQRLRGAADGRPGAGEGPLKVGTKLKEVAAVTGASAGAAPPAPTPAGGVPGSSRPCRPPG